MSYFENRSTWENFRDFKANNGKNYRAIQEHKVSDEVWDLYEMNTEGKYTRLITIDLQGFKPNCYNIFRQYERCKRT